MTNALDDTSLAVETPEQGTNDPIQTLVGIGPGHILFFAFIVAIFSVLWFGSYQFLNNLIWENDFVEANRWIIPVGVMFFSLLVGLAQRYLHAPNSIEGDALDPVMAGDTKVYRRFWGTLATSFASLLSGASVGPEGPLGYLAVDVTTWVSERIKLPKEGIMPACMAGMSSAYNGLVGNSVFTALLTTETTGGKGGLPQLVANLAAGVVGFLVFALIGMPPFAGTLEEGQPFELSISFVLWAIVLGLIGTLLAIYISAAMKGAAKLMGAFGDRTITRALAGGAVIAVVGYFLPVLLFSGEASIGPIMADPAQVGIGMLLLLALAKPLLLALSFKSGYLGGPIFPALFAAIMIGLALSLLFPDVPVKLLTACIQAAVVTLIIGAPLTSILLVSIITAADANLLELIVVSAVTATIARQLLNQVTAKRQAKSGAGGSD